jgi:putative methyltransferase (TIGR04325 family)
MGYDHPAIFERVREATLKVQRNEAAFERDSVAFEKPECNGPLLAALFEAAASDNGELRVLDFGGSLGSAYFQHRSFLSSIHRIRWGVVEQAHYVDYGRSSVEDGVLRFFTSVDECVAAFRPNLALFGSVLQYVKEYQEILRSVTTVRPRVIVMDRGIVHAGDEDVVYVQRVPRWISKVSYPCYSLSESRLVAQLHNESYQLVGSFEAPPLDGLTAISATLKTHIFRRID